MRTKTVPSWVMELRVEVAKLVGLPKNRERFLDMIREWKRPEIQRRAVRDADSASPPAPRIRCPLPMGDKNLSLPEKYVALAMIHDALLEPSGRITPRVASADALADPYDAMAFIAFRDEDALLEMLPDNSEALLRAVLEIIQSDLSESHVTPLPHVTRGVKLLSAALALLGLSDDVKDRELRKKARSMKDKWGKRRTVKRPDLKLPDPVGYDTDDSQAFLYAAAELCEYLEVAEPHRITRFGGAKMLLRELKSREHDVLPAAS